MIIINNNIQITIKNANIQLFETVVTVEVNVEVEVNVDVAAKVDVAVEVNVDVDVDVDVDVAVDVAVEIMVTDEIVDIFCCALTNTKFMKMNKSSMFFFYGSIRNTKLVNDVDILCYQFFIK